MFDDGDEALGVFDFDELADHLVEQGLETSPAELHGALSGLLAAGSSAEPEAGLALLQQVLDLSLHGELAGQLLQLHQVSAAAMEDEAFQFYPLLPDDDNEIAVRTAALGRWCSGFLGGFGHLNQRQPDTDSAEILKDFAAIAEAAVDDDADEEESEAAYSEIVEYVRFGCLNIYLDSRSEPTESGSRELH